MGFEVLIYGEDHPGSLYRSYKRGFEQNGAIVTGYCPDQVLRQILPSSQHWATRRLLSSLAARELNRRVQADITEHRPDLILVLKGAQLSGDTVRQLRRETGAVVANYYPDDPFSDVRSNRLVHGPGVLASYDICFTFARHLVPDYRRVGVRTIEYLPFARDPALHAPADDVGDPDFDIVFVGNLDQERVAWLESVADFRIVVFGEHTRKALRRRSQLQQAIFRPAVYGLEFARAIRRGAIAVNLMRLQNARSHNMRSFESPACGAFTMSQRTPELTELFRENEEIVCFGSREEFRAQVTTWLARSPAERDMIARAGFRRVEGDTYARRALAIQEKVLGVAHLARAAP